MSSKVMKVFGAMVVGLAFAAGATQGCGSSSGGNAADLCDRTCVKAVECSGGLLTSAQCKSLCTTQTKGPNGQRCTNEAALVAKANECLATTTCEAFLACGNPPLTCQVAASGTAGTGGSGAAGTTGTAGTGSTGAAGFTFDGGFPFDASGLLGAAGSAGSTCTTACTKADACCAAVLGSASQCTFKATCDASSNQAQSVTACNLFLSGIGAQGASAPAACK